jgi:hypothetical protein
MALTTLERYARIKPTLRSEWFLNRSRVWVSRWVRMRGGVQELEVTMGWWRSPQVSREDRPGCAGNATMGWWRMRSTSGCTAHDGLSRGRSCGGRCLRWMIWPLGVLYKGVIGQS